MVHSLLFALALAAQLPDPDPSAIVAGRVLDAASRRPVAGAIVTPAGSSATTIPGASGATSALTNASGLFVIRGLRAGTLFLTATKGGYVLAT